MFNNDICLLSALTYLDAPCLWSTRHGILWDCDRERRAGNPWVWSQYVRRV